MKLLASALIIVALLSIVAGISARMSAQQPPTSSVSVSLKYVLDESSARASIDVKIKGESVAALYKMLGGASKAKSVLSERLNIPSELINIKFTDKEAHVSLKLAGHAPPYDGIDFIIQEDIGSAIALLLEKIGLTGIPINLSLGFDLPKGAEVKELVVSPENAFNVSVEGSRVVITSRSSLTLGKGSFSLYLRYSNPKSRRNPGE
ncbi:MAG: hypothetical protein DRN92_05265 [Thermoproteota archaeon]|nr:MAG: hypothetical protein DRN92_05265 [Candidatus Korarchaeota archaeon]